MRCLYCGKQLALFRRLTGSGEFCSDAHKQSYHEEYNRLALTRLIAAQTKSDEVKLSLRAPSTMQIATGDRKQTRGIEEARGQGSSSRWASIPSHPRVLHAPPTESAPPAPASFILTRPDLVQAPIPVPGRTEFSDYQGRPEVTTCTWTPPIAEDEAAPPQAGPLPSTSIPEPVAASAPDIPVSLAFPATALPALEISVDVRPIAGLQPRPSVAIDFMQFAPKPRSKPASCEQFEKFRFAVMVFGAPTLDLLAEGLTFEKPPVLQEVGVIQEDAASDALLWKPINPIPLDTKPASAPAPEEQPTPKPFVDKIRIVPDLNRAEDSAAKSEKPGPRLPTIAPPVRKNGPVIPSILQKPVEPRPQQTKSIWSSLRKYMKK